MAVLKPFKTLRPIQLLASQISSNSSKNIKDNIYDNNKISEQNIKYSSVETIDILQLKKDKCLITDEFDKLFIYEINYQSSIISGIVAHFSFSDIDNGTIKIMETDDDAPLINNLHKQQSEKFQLSPVELIFKDNPLLESSIKLIKSENKPILDVLDDDSTKHTIWEIPYDYSEVFFDEFSKMKSLITINGAEICSFIRKNSTTSNSFMGVAYSESDYVKNVQDLIISNDVKINQMELIHIISNNFHTEIADKPNANCINLYFDKQWYTLKNKKYLGNRVLEQQQTKFVDELIIKEIEKSTNLNREVFVSSNNSSGSYDLLENLIDSKDAFAAITFKSINFNDLEEISKDGEKLPFGASKNCPMIREGLLIHELQ